MPSHIRKKSLPRLSVLLFCILAIGCLLSPSFVLAADLFCDYCKNRVSGRYFKAGDKVACNRCYKRYDKCPGCNMPVRAGMHSYKGQRVCKDCARKAGICGHCGDVLIGAYYKADKNPDVDGFCETCYKSKPRCSICDLPWPGMHQTSKGRICPSCIKQVDNCSACKEPITHIYYTVEHVKGKFCKSCYENQPHCDFCGRPLSEDGRKLTDGRHACASCNKEAVTNTTEMLGMLAELAAFCEKEMNIPAPRPFDFVVVDNKDMATASRKNRKNDETDDTHSSSDLRELGFFDSNLIPQSPRATVTILSNLPRTACMETLAHEYAHIWQFAVNPALKDRKVIEGFAQWLAAKWLLENREWAAYSKLASRRDPIYGEGFHFILQIEKQHGRQGVLRYVSQHQKENDARAYPDKAPSLKPLSEILPSTLLDGPYDFLNNAVVVTPQTLKKNLKQKSATD